MQPLTRSRARASHILGNNRNALLMTNAIKSEFSRAYESISWAEEAILELNMEIRDFFKKDIATVITEVNPNTREHVQKLRMTQLLPKHFRRKATEALTNSRHAFDQATFAARNLTGKRSQKSVYYPWSQSPTDLKRLLSERGLDNALWRTFESHEPYPRSDAYIGGDDVMRSLATMANGKHTVGLSIQAHITRVGLPRT